MSDDKPHREGGPPFRDYVSPATPPPPPGDGSQEFPAPSPGKGLGILTHHGDDDWGAIWEDDHGFVTLTDVGWDAALVWMQSQPAPKVVVVKDGVTTPLEEYLAGLS